MIKTIKLYQARALINQRNVDGLFYVDKVSVEGCTDIIFKSDLSDQLYSFYYCENDDYDMTIGTVLGFNAPLDDSHYDDFDVEVAPVKKVTVTSYEYVRDDSND